MTILASLLALALGACACGTDRSGGTKPPGGRLERPLAVLPEAFEATDPSGGPAGEERLELARSTAGLPGAVQVRNLSARSPVPPGGGSATRGEYEDFVKALLPLIDRFWAKNARRLSHDARYEPPGVLISYRGADGPGCSGEYAARDAGNAFYCPTLNPPDDCPAVSLNGYWCSGEDQIAWDEELTFALYRYVGNLAAALVLAHEWGHLMQARAAEPFYGEDPPIASELQADCLAGAWARAMERDARLRRDAFENAVAGFYEIKGLAASQWLDPSTHGSARQRKGAFLRGYKREIRACRAERFEPFLEKLGVARSG